MLAFWSLVLSALFAPLVSAQFQFFDQFFGGQQSGGQQQQGGNVASDSKWYQQTWEGGEFEIYLFLR